MNEQIDMFGDTVGTAPTSKPENVTELQIKWHSVELPSKGRLGYPATVEYRDILVRDEKILSSSTDNNYRKTLSRILKGLLKDQSYYEQLSITDRDYLLMWIWANNYSVTKEYSIRCRGCETEGNHSVNLTELDVTELSDKYDPNLKIPLGSGHTIGVRTITVGDEDIAEEYSNKNKEVEYTDVLMALSIITPTVLPIKQKLEWVSDNITGKEMGMVRAFHSYFQYGVDTNAEYHCSACGEVTPFEIPFSPDFFLPTVQSDFEALLFANKTTEDKSD